VQEIVNDLRAVRALISKTSKSFIAQLKLTSTPLETKVVLAQAQLCLARLYAFPTDQLGITPDVLASLSSFPSLPLLQLQTVDPSPFHTALSELLSLHLALRRIPEIELSVPTLVLVGAPNVGKSSIVRLSHVSPSLILYMQGRVDRDSGGSQLSLHDQRTLCRPHPQPELADPGHGLSWTP
jgi:hypothetical protein